MLSYHFIGIGGCGMSALAQMLHHQGHRVSGSDLTSSSVAEKLSGLGISVQIGHDPAAMPEVIDCLVVSAA
ncbi:MAG: UDP-N-acetylmuramate--L-alanine ligase, partial [Planctomycetes bacterium]|nr:UDP-N-acetylmuramate--L-alanine ligase [Planctomycetota bacterium]